MKYIITILLIISACTPKPEKATGSFTSITIGNTRITGVETSFDADSLSDTRLVTVGLLYKSIKANGTTIHMQTSIIGKGTLADPLRVNPDMIIQKGNTAFIKANAKTGQLWYNTETNTMIFHNSYGLRSINTSNVP